MQRFPLLTLGHAICRSFVELHLFDSRMMTKRAKYSGMPDTRSGVGRTV
jgi:hypothetical protein